LTLASLASAAKRGRLSQYGGRPLSDDDPARLQNGYWYLEQLKNFAERIGMPAAKKLQFLILVLQFPR
jgi:hypothetical protein